MSKSNRYIVLISLVTAMCAVLYVGFGAYYLDKSIAARHEIMQVQSEIAELSDIQFEILKAYNEGEKYSYAELGEQLKLNRDNAILKSTLNRIQNSRADYLGKEDIDNIHFLHKEKTTLEKSLSEALSRFGRYGYVLLILAVICFAVIAYLIIMMKNAQKRLTKLYDSSVAIYNNSNDLIINTDKSGRIDRCSDSIQNVLGYTSDEVIGMNISKLISNDNHSEQISKDLLKSGSYLGEVENVKKDGSKITCLLSANAIYDSSGNMTGSLGISRGISDLNTIKNEYSYLLSNIADIVYRTDTTGHFTYANPAIKHILGYDINEFVGLHFTELVHPDNLNEVISHYKIFPKSKDEKSTIEFMCKTAANDYVWVAQHVRKIFNENGVLTGYTGVVRNIEERKRFEIAIEQSEQKYRELFENSLEIIHSIAPDGKFIYVNNSWKKNLGYSDEEIGSMNIMDIVAPNCIDHCQALFHEILTTGQCKDGSVNYDVITNEGNTLHLSGTVSVSESNGEIISIQSFLRDVTFEIKAQKVIQTQLKEINESIDYAKNIQDSILPNKDKIRTIFNNSYIYHEAKDVISGDFYDVSYIKTNDGANLKSAVVADCTGHGVPGGVLTMLCSAFLRDSYKDGDVNSPADSLNFVRDRLIQFFSSSQNKSIKDGMDVSFAVINPETLELFASCANQRILILRNGEILEIQGIKQSVGYSEQIEDFRNDSMQLESGDKLIMYSDGFVDQFGGPSAKKFMRKRLHELLLSNAQLSCEELGALLESEHRNWKGDNESTDDVTLMVLGV